MESRDQYIPCKEVKGKSSKEKEKGTVKENPRKTEKILELPAANLQRLQTVHTVRRIIAQSNEC